MDINSLVDIVKNDLERDGSYDRYPVRYFSINYENGTSDALIQLRMKLNGVEIFDIKDILPHKDAWITVDYLRKIIYELDKTKSFIVIGFSEYARFLSQSEFISLIISFLELENPAENPKRRIYIPCFALYSEIKKTIRTYHRRLDVYNPLLNEADVEDLPRIYFIEDVLNADCHSNEVVNSAEWFGMWRNSDIDTQRPIICSSRTLTYFYTVASPDNVYNIQHLKTYQDILRYMYRIDNLRAYKQDSDVFYSRVIALVKSDRKKELVDIILSEVNARSIDASNIYNLWKTSDIFKRWLIQNYVLIKLPKNTYLYKVMDSIEDLIDKEFIEKMYESIFEYKDLSFVEERRTILCSIKKAEKDITFTDQMKAYYDAFMARIIRENTTVSLEGIDFIKAEKILSDKQEVLAKVVSKEIAPYLTSFSSYERQLTIWLYRMKFIDDMQVKVIYPVLGDYISESESGAEPEEFTDKFDLYFKTYRELRLAQNSGSVYDVAISNWNQDGNTFYDWYLSGKIEYPEVYLKKKNFTGVVYVLDGVGAEFLGVILKLLEKKGYTVEDAAYGKCHLPSITSVAKNFYPLEYEWIYDYDNQVIHGGTYYHVDNVEKALTIIENMVDRIISAEGEKSFAITADHGSTVGHKLHKKDKRYNFCKSEHDGRCYNNKDGQHIDSSADYVSYYDDETGKQWVIALNQQSLFNNSKYSVHGGATLEEVLVPVIIIQKGKQTSKFYKVRAIDLKVSGLQKKVEFEINPMLKEARAVLKAKDGTNTELVYNEATNTWVGELKRGIEQDIEVSIGKKIFKFRTVPPTKMGDDLFDD